MHIQILGSGSKGNSALVRAGETHLLIDAGLPKRELVRRLKEDARVQPLRIDHVALTHGHLGRARLVCSESIMRNASVRKAPHMFAFTVDRALALEGPHDDVLHLRPVRIPHDADPTVAFRIEHRGRTAVVVTDMGRPDRQAARGLAGAHVMVLEFNHDPELLRLGPYTASLKRRIAGDRGHLSNEQAAEMLRLLAGAELHTLVLAHLSEVNNTPELALAAARRALGELGLTGVRILVADQHAVGPNLKV
ncbi:MAG: MBL fold metallo-hydrolase [Planctomycetota bacterium]|nr:MBL fold metallo-hydrolase [Planctomycetota bacterium]